MQVEIFGSTKKGFAVALTLAPGTVVFFIEGKPEGFLHNGELSLSASLPPGAFKLNFPGYGSKADNSKAVPEKEVENSLIFRDRESNSKLHRAFADMPFGALANFELRGASMSLADVAGNVERLRAVLADHSEGDRRRDERLEKLETAVDGFGSLLKLAVASWNPGEDPDSAAAAEESAKT